MKDRIPTHAGRVQLTPVSGNIYDMTMADEPTEQGTALNKANLLTDATAALLAKFGNTPDTVNEALASLSTAVGVESFSYVGTGTYGDKANATVIAFQHEPKIFFITPCSGSWTNYSRDEAWFDWEALKTAWNNRGSADYASTRYQNVDNTYYYELRFEISGNTIYLWTVNYNTGQYNNENGIYRVTSIY